MPDVYSGTGQLRVRDPRGALQHRPALIITRLTTLDVPVGYTEYFTLRGRYTDRLLHPRTPPHRILVLNLYFTVKRFSCCLYVKTSTEDCLYGKPPSKPFLLNVPSSTASVVCAPLSYSTEDCLYCKPKAVSIHLRLRLCPLVSNLLRRRHSSDSAALATRRCATSIWRARRPRSTCRSPT